MWLTDPELFLYSKVGGDDVQLWRCKNTMMNNSSSPLVVPMVPDDFEYVSQVEDHSDLVDGDILEWEETDYKALVKYISERRLLVNGQGLVIAELSKFSEEGEDEDEDEDDDQTDAAELSKFSEEGEDEDEDDDQTDADILPTIIYLRSLDILQLKAYIPDLIEQPIPSRKVQYLEDADGKAAPVLEEGGDSTTTTTTISTKLLAELQGGLKRERSEKHALAERVADVEVKIKTVEAKSVNLDGTNTQLGQYLADAEFKNRTLEARNVNLDGTNTKLKQDLADAQAGIKALETVCVQWNQMYTDLGQKHTERIKALEKQVKDAKRRK